MNKSPFFIVSYFNFLDEGSRVGGLRPYYLYQKLLRKGINVKLVTPSFSSQNNIVVKEGFLIKFFKPILKIFPPDGSIFWAMKVFFYLRKINRGDKFIVFTTMPPYGIGLVGFLCKIFLKNTIWISDYRDLWTENTLYSPPITKKYIDPILERHFHKKADLVVLNTKSDCELHQRIFPFIKKKSIFVRNGFNKFTENKSTNSNRFIYSGGTYKGIATKQIIIFLNILNGGRSDFFCDFFGEHDESMDGADHIKYCGSVAPDAVPELLGNYKYGFVYLPEGSQNGGRVAQKFYDYLGSGVIPICFNASNEMKNIINELNTGIIISDKVSKIEIKNFVKNAKFNTNLEQMKNFTRDSQFEYLLTEILERNIF